MKNVARELMNFGELIENDHTPVQEPNMMQEEHRWLKDLMQDGLIGVTRAWFIWFETQRRSQ